MATLYVHTRAGGFRRWVAVETARSQQEARDKIAKLQAQDDPMWRAADYLISDSRNPSPDETPYTGE